MTTTRAKSVVVLLSVLSIIDVTPFNLRIFNVFETVLLVSLIVKGKKDIYIHIITCVCDNYKCTVCMIGGSDLDSPVCSCVCVFPPLTSCLSYDLNASQVFTNLFLSRQTCYFNLWILWIFAFHHAFAS